jgi:hypothetical protein
MLDRTTIELAERMVSGVCVPFRLCLAALRPCGSQLAVDSELLAAAAQWQADNVSLNVSAALDAAMTMMMEAR